MSDRDPTTAGNQEAEASDAIDPVALEMALGRLRSEQNLGGALGAGAVAAAVGAAAWAATTVFIGYQIGWMAVGVGFLVGYAVRYAGKGIDKTFGGIGAVWSLLGCAAGNLLAVCGLVAKQQGVPLAQILTDLDLALASEMMIATFSPMDLLFYGVAVYEGYKFSFRRLTEADLDPYQGGEMSRPT